jgi:hypothetical protein
MDRFAAWVPGQDDGDLVLLLEQGMAYQKDQSSLVAYDGAYFDKLSGYEGSDICEAIHQGRVALVDKYTKGLPVIDIGIGCGEFVKRRPQTWGYDVNPTAEAWLRDRGLWRDTFTGFAGYTLFDVIEHIPDPNDYFQFIAQGSYLFTSIPIFDELTRIRESKHYRPGEHLYYWTRNGFVQWMGKYGFTLLEEDDFETRAGRESILSFAFNRLYG